MITPYPSPRAALAAAADLSRSLSYPKQADSPRVQTVPDGEALDRPIAVRAALVRAGIEPDGEDAELLYRWATTADAREVELDDGTTVIDRSDEWDEALGQARGEAEHHRLRAEGEAIRARLTALLEVVGEALVEAGVVRKPPKLKLYRVGYRVVETDGRRSVQMVIDPSGLDPSVITGPNAEIEAARIARGEAEGVIVEQTVLEVGRKHPDLAAELGPRWDAGEFAYLQELDAEIADRLRCSAAHARKVRASWGIHGSRGQTPTRPPGTDLSLGNDAA